MSIPSKAMDGHQLRFKAHRLRRAALQKARDHHISVNPNDHSPALPRKLAKHQSCHQVGIFRNDFRLLGARHFFNKWIVVVSSILKFKAMVLYSQSVGHVVKKLARRILKKNFQFFPSEIYSRVVPCPPGFSCFKFVFMWTPWCPGNGGDRYIFRELRTHWNTHPHGMRVPYN